MNHDSGRIGLVSELCACAVAQARERGLLRTLNNWLHQNVPGFPEFFALFEQFAGAIPGQNHPRRRQTYEQRFAKVRLRSINNANYDGR